MNSDIIKYDQDSGEFVVRDIDGNVYRFRSDELSGVTTSGPAAAKAGEVDIPMSAKMAVYHWQQDFGGLRADFIGEALNVVGQVLSDQGEDATKVWAQGVCGQLDQHGRELVELLSAAESSHQ